MLQGGSCLKQTLEYHSIRHCSLLGKSIYNANQTIELPPPKKQRTAKQVVPPIIIGLFEPPPQSTLFPPIASSSFHDSHGRNTLNTVPPKVNITRDTSDLANNDTPQTVEKNPTKRRITKARKKWTEEETNTLLLGVAKHGTGSWTDIIKDPSFKFNERSALDLKDRFRTCCPEELRQKNRQPKSPIPFPSGKPPKSSLMSENILLDIETPQSKTPGTGVQAVKGRKNRTHRKKLEDLAQLGIEDPFRKSGRRERRPYSEEEDRAILEGYNAYGPSWSTIQRNPQYGLQSRQPTDIRDRFRTKYPERFRNEVEGRKEHLPPANRASHVEESRDAVNSGTNQSSSTLQHQGQGQEIDAKSQDPSFQSFSSREGLRIQEIISPEHEFSKSLPLQVQNSMFNFKDNFGNFGDQPTLDPSDTLPFIQSFDWAPGISAPFSNEMDISRLLLDETWSDIPGSSTKERQSFTDINSIVTSNSEPLHNLPSFFNMLNDPDQIENMNDASF
jgi:hypothetical protein